ncbi:MAG: hypothetical protein HY905_11885 [Deltaproteobacteria bacterium]|nr:hypothetical protein [Deltaproteobacteria bacterium]
MSISKRLTVVGVVLAVFLGGVSAASSDAEGAKVSAGRINKAADILGSSRTDRERALRGDCAVINDNDLRRICQGECSTINNSDVRRLCNGNCGEITDPDIRRACQAG